MSSRAAPVLGWIGSYRVAYLRSDLVAGVTTAAVVIPQAMAYATIAGLPLEAGLYCALVPMAVYAFLGTSRPLSVSTTSTISLLTAQAISMASASDAGATAATLALLVGGFLLLAGILRLGFLADFISPHVLLGFKIGTGLLIMADQVGKILGVEESGSNFFEKISSVLANLGETNPPTLLLGASSLVALILLRRFAPRLPGALIVLVLGIVVVGWFSLGSEGVALGGGVPTGLPKLAFPDLGLVSSLLAPAAGIALMSFVESIGAGRTFRRFDDPPLDSNQELRALGVAGIAASVTQAYPVGGGLSQTAVNDSSGAATQASGLVTSVVVLATLLFLAPLFDNLAQATLGALVLVAAAGLVDLKTLGVLRRVGWLQWIGATLPLVTVLVFGTLEGVLVGVLFSLLVVLHLLDQPFLETLTRDATGSVAVVEDGVALLAPSTAGLRIAHPVYYANQRRVVDAIEEWLDSFEPSPQRLFVDLPAQTESGPAFADFLRHLQRMLATAGTDLIVCGMSAHALEQLHRTQVWAEIEAEVDIFPSIQAAIDGSD